MPATTPRAYQIGDIDWKQAVKAVAVTYQNPIIHIVDGITFNDGDRALFAGQGDPTLPLQSSALNGIYQWSNKAGSFIRSIDASVQGSVSAGLTLQVTEGLIYADTTWVLITDDPIQIGITPLQFEQSGATASGSNGAIQFASALANKLSSDPNFTYTNATKTLDVPNISTANIAVNGNVSANYFIGNGSLLTGINASGISGTFTGNVIASNIIPTSNTVTLGSTQNPFAAVYATSGVNIGTPQNGVTLTSPSAGVAELINSQTGSYASVTTGNLTSGNVTATSVVSTGSVTAPSATVNTLTTHNITNSNTIATNNLTVSGYANINQLNYANGNPVTFVTEIFAGTGLTTADGNPISTVGTLALANSGVTAGIYGSATQTPRIAVDATGRIVVGGNVTITPAFSSITGTPTTLAGYGITDAVNKNQLGVATSGLTTGVATLDVSGKIPVAQLPPIAISNTFVVANYTDLANLTAEPGDVGIVTANSTSYILQSAPPSTLTNWVELLFPSSVVSVNGYTGAVNLSFNDVGAVSNVVTITAGNGLTGGGNLKSNISLSIANTGVTAGTYGDPNFIPQVTVGADGRVSNITNVAVDPSSSLIYSIALG